MFYIRMFKRIIYCVIAIVISLSIFHPGRHAKNYPFIKQEDVYEELVPSKMELHKNNLNICDYEKLILKNDYLDQTNKHNDLKHVLHGGEYIPSGCKAIFKTAIIVPYRDREQQLELFLNYMHYFLQKQQIHYRIFIVEQNDDLPFNRAKMLNVGAYEAIKQQYPCLILHDIDLYPLNIGNIYACAKRPRHMSSSIDVFRFNLLYLGLFGGVCSIQSRHFQLINGMSNMFAGWGGEDDDFFERLQAHGLTPYRFTSKVSEYTMLVHKKQHPSGDRYKLLQSALKRMKVDGLNSTPTNYSLKLFKLYTRIIVS